MGLKNAGWEVYAVDAGQVDGAVALSIPLIWEQELVHEERNFHLSANVEAVE